MKYKNVFWGLLLIITGGLIIGRNLDLLYFDWYSFLKLWPIIFILWGISVLPIRDIFKTVLLVIILAGSTWFVTHSHDDYRNKDFDNWLDYYQDNSKWDFDGKQDFALPFNDSIQNVKLTMDAAAGSFHLKDTTNNLLDFHEIGSRRVYKYILEQNQNNARVKITDKRNHVYLFNNGRRVVNMKLNSKPVWDIDINAGAGELNFDLSQYKVERFNMDGGAGSFKVTLGDLYPDTQFTLDAGASSIVIRVPESSGCSLQMSSVLSDRNINGFHKVGDGHYKTNNFDTAKNKIRLNIDAAISSFTIIRY